MTNHALVCRILTSKSVSLYVDEDDAWADIARLKAAGYHLLGVAGARARNTDADKHHVTHDLYEHEEAYPTLAIVSGACPKGADRFAAEYVRDYLISGVPHLMPVLIEFPFRSDKGRSGGFYRNELVAKCCDQLLAYPAGTGGTEHTIARVKALGKEVTIR